MHILKNTFLYTLLVLFAVGGVVTLVPNDAKAHSTPCEIVMDEPAGATVYEPSAIFDMHVHCDSTAQYTVYNETDGEVIYGPQRLYTWDSQTSIGEFYDEHHDKEFRHTFDSCGQKSISATLTYGENAAGEDVYMGSTGVTGCESNTCSCSVSISGDSSIQLPDSGDYTASFNYSGDAVRYRFFIDNVKYFDWKTTTNNSASRSIDWSNYGEGEYQVCVSAESTTGGNVCSETKTSCMDVIVDKTTTPSATLHVESQNPNSGVGMDFAGNSTHFADQRFETYKEFNRNGDIDVRVFAEGTNQATGNTFDGWSGCDYEDGSGDRACNITVKQGNTRTITAAYIGDFCDENPDHSDCTDDPDPEDPDPEDPDPEDPDPNQAGLNVRSQGLSNVPINHVTRWQIGDGDTTNYTKYYDSEIDDVWIQAPRNRSGMTIDYWNGCDRTADNERSCFIDQISLGQTRTFTVVYKPGTTEPDKAVLNVSSQGISNVPINHLREDILGSDGRTNYTRTYDEAVPAPPDGRWWWLTAPSERSGFEATDWNGCDRVANGGSSCGLDTGIALNETRNLTVIYEEAAAPGCTDPDATNYDPDATENDGSCEYQAVILNFNATPTELHVDDQPFELIWSTEHADSVAADSDDSDQWFGANKGSSGDQLIDEGPISDTSETFTYNLTAYGSGGNDSASVSVTILDPPRFDLDTTDDVTDIDGEPGSQATNQVEVTSSKYTDDVA